MKRENDDQSWFAVAVRHAQKVDPTIPRLTPHDLRHTAASLASSAGANVKAVQKMLGHASAAMTLDPYGSVRRRPRCGRLALAERRRIGTAWHL